MTQSDIILERSRALRFFGDQQYYEMLKSAKEYFDRNQYQIPTIGGVEAMPEFWNSIRVIMEDSINGSTTT